MSNAEDRAIAAARALIADGWQPYSAGSRLGLDVRDWTDVIRHLLARIDRPQETAENPDGRA